MTNKRNIIRIVIAIIMCLVIIAVPLSVMLVANNIDDKDTPNPPIVEDNNSSADEGLADKGESQEDTNPHGEEDVDDGKITIYVTITSTNLFGEGGAKYIDDVRLKMGDELFNGLNNGNMLTRYELRLAQKSNAMDATKEAVRANNILISESNGYISSFGGLAHKMAGNGSGWIYHVNDKYMTVGADYAELKDGDEVKWFYVVGGR